MYTLRQLAEHVDGRVMGDPKVTIRRIQPFEVAEPGDLTLAAEKKYYDHLKDTQASAVIVEPHIKSEEESLAAGGETQGGVRPSYAVV